MGLSLGRKMGAGFRQRHWLVPAGIAVLSIGIAMGGEIARQWLKYDRLSIQSGELWRLASGHFTHLGAAHLGLNLAGLFLVWALVGSRLSLVAWLVVVVLAFTGVSLGFWYLDENLLWYVGLSGMLHSLLVAGAFSGLLASRGESAVILALVFGKIAYEQIAGPLPGSENTAGGPVIVNAHLYGVITGVIVGLPLWHGVGRARSIKMKLTQGNML